MLYFEKLLVWHKSIDLASECVRIANSLPRKYQYSFSDQLIRAALSISSNIAEGSGRRTKRDQANFYAMAKGSLYETVNILKLLERIGDLDAETTKKLSTEAEEVAKMLHGLIR